MGKQGISCGSVSRLQQAEDRIRFLRCAIERIGLVALGEEDCARIRTECKEALKLDERYAQVSALEASDETPAAPKRPDKARRCPGYGHPDCWMEQDGHCMPCTASSA